jgi:hypothetical protein
MASFASPPASIADPAVTDAARATAPANKTPADANAQSPAADAAAKLRHDENISRKNTLIPTDLLVRLDEDAGRFVQTFSDAVTHETLLQYPSDVQLAFSRAVNAYLRARLET